MIFFLYGENDFSAKQKIAELREKFIREVDASEQNINIVDGATAKLTDITNFINTGSLFVRKRLIIIENIFANKKNLVEEFFNFLKNSFSADNENIIIIYESRLKTDKKDKIVKANAVKDTILTIKEKKLFELLKVQKFSKEFKNFTAPELIQWVKKEVATNGQTINPAAVTTLINLVGSDLWQLSNEIKKLTHFKNKDDKTEISVAEVKNLVSANFDENIFALTDALGAKNCAQALKILEEQYKADAAPEYILTMLVRHFKILLQIKDGLEKGVNQTDINKQLWLNPYVFNKNLSQVRNFTSANLKTILNELIEADYLNKTGQRELKVSLGLLIGRI
jgi:DNA polymerase-3 subunit delta